MERRRRAGEVRLSTCIELERGLYRMLTVCDAAWEYRTEEGGAAEG